MYNQKSGTENIKVTKLMNGSKKESEEGWHIQPDESINQEEFALQYS
ncbi:MAG: hypothetical protein R2757_03095 [Draconibacterium sp.]